MPTNGPLNTPFGSPLVSPPDPGSGTMRGSPVEVQDNASGQGLTGTPFERPLAGSSMSPGETSNSGGLPTHFDTVGNIPGAPAVGTVAGVADGVATPNTPVGNMTGGPDVAKGERTHGSDR